MQEMFSKFIDSLIPWLMTHGVRILIILFVAYLAKRFSGNLIDSIVRRTVVSKGFLSPAAEKKREDTLIAVFEGVLKAIIWFITIFMIVAEFGVNIGPLLAGAGVIGLAIGFGAQYIIRDFFTGLFIILENQYRVGDVVCIDTVCGTVEDINLRMTILRDTDGAVHHIPNGEVKIATNKTKGFARVNLIIGIAYDADIEKVKGVVNKVGQEMANNKEWKDKIIKAPRFVRVDNFGPSSVDIKISGEVQPQEQWDVMGELRQRIKKAFDKEGIEIPFPQQVIRQAKEK